MDDIQKDTLMLFVYGTLKIEYRSDRSSFFNQYRLEAVKAKIFGYDMYSNGSFPMIVKSDDTNAVVFGEYHYYNHASIVLRRCDLIEGYDKRTDNGMYLRRKEIVYDMDDEEIGPCFLYVWNMDINPELRKLDGIF